MKKHKRCESMEDWKMWVHGRYESKEDVGVEVLEIKRVWDHGSCGSEEDVGA